MNNKRQAIKALKKTIRSLNNVSNKDQVICIINQYDNSKKRYKTDIHIVKEDY